jgi:3-phosphoshikimate 1-carboxyvinyltransferase
LQSLEIVPSLLEGSVRIPPSKSISHRAIICAGLADGISRIENIILSEDIKATLEGLVALGVPKPAAEQEKNSWTLNIRGTPNIKSVSPTVNCRESGSTLRFLLPLATLTGEEMTFTGQGKLVERPLDVYYDIFDEQQLAYSTSGGLLPLTINGRLKPGTYRLKGNVSSQFITGLMFLLPLLKGDSHLILTTKLESRGYVDLTLDVLQKFGIEIENRGYQEFFIRGNQKYESCNYRVEGDYSQAAFWIVAGILGQGIDCVDLNPDSLQGDKAIIDIVGQMGANLEILANRVRIRSSTPQATVIDAEHCPDLVPVLAVLAALSEGTSRIINAGRLRIKESDRLKAITTELNKLGAKITELDQGLVIEGVKSLRGGVVDSWNDHRIAMALAVASLRCKEPIYLTGFEAVNKSYPAFWKDFKELGGKIDEWHLG